MKKVLIFIFLELLVFLSLYASSSEENFKLLYERMKEKYSSIYPTRFESYIEGEIVSKQIATIPARSILSSKDNVKLKFSFSKGAKPVIILENVDSFYRGMFGVFEVPLETMGFYTLVSVYSSYASLSKKFSFESFEEKSNNYNVVLRAFGDDKDYSIKYIVNKDSLLIERAEYYNKKRKVYDVFITYTDIEEYTLPDSISFKSSDGRVNSKINFVNTKTFSK